MTPPPLSRRQLLGGGLWLVGGWVLARAWGHRPLAGAPDGAFLGPSARATLQAALEALLPDGADAAAVAADVDAFLAAGDPVLGGQLRLALGALEHLAGVGPLTTVRFSRMPLGRRREVLEAWRVSGLGPKRRIADALRRVALFSWYTRPETWPGLGYDGPWVGR